MEMTLFTRKLSLLLSSSLKLSPLWRLALSSYGWGQRAQHFRNIITQFSRFWFSSVLITKTCGEFQSILCFVQWSFRYSEEPAGIFFMTRTTLSMMSSMYVMSRLITPGDGLSCAARRKRHWGCPPRQHHIRCLWVSSTDENRWILPPKLLVYACLILFSGYFLNTSVAFSSFV